MNLSDHEKSKVEHLDLINEKFDELDLLVHEYLQYIRTRGGTLGFCVGSIGEKLRHCRMSLNDMCGKLPYYRYCPKTGMLSGKEVNTSVIHRITCYNTWHLTASDSVTLHWANEYSWKWSVNRYSSPKLFIRWRHHVLQIEAKAERTDNHEWASIDFIHEGEYYRNLVSRGHGKETEYGGDALPVLYSETHKLLIKPFVYGLILTDIPLKETDRGTTDAFQFILTTDQ
jgi:hypothetical protein